MFRRPADAMSIVLPRDALSFPMLFKLAPAGTFGIATPAALYLAATFAVAIFPTCCGALFVSLYSDVAFSNCDLLK